MSNDLVSPSQNILHRAEFKQSTLGIHISKNGITFCLHPAHQDVSYVYFDSKHGKFTKQQILREMDDWNLTLKTYLPHINILATTISFPGPIEGDSVEIPNWWSTGDNKFCKAEFSEFSFSKCQFEFINEIQALGHGLISTDEFFGLEDDFIPLWKPPALETMPTLYPLYFSSDAAAVLQVAYGLGAAFIVPIDSSDSYRVIASEWGHSLVQLCGPDEPNYDEELELIKFIGAKNGHAVEWEDIVSSRGLINCYEFAQHGVSDGQDVLAIVEKDPNEPIAQKALSIHFRFLMRFARMCAISFTCKSLFITYSVFPGGVKALQKHIPLCRDEFMHFTKSEWVSSVSVFVQTSDKNISALGVMYHAFLRLARSESDEVNGDYGEE